MNRRDFFKSSLVASAAIMGTNVNAGVTTQPIDSREVSNMAFPEKKPLITYSDRPPLLESPRSTFTQALTPNDEFFVRWHLPEIPTHIDPDKYTIHINGLVDKELHISLNDLRTNFEQVEVDAVLQCGGNSRSAFKPIAGGIQWGSGAMGCARWKGVRLSDILSRAGLKKEAKFIGFNGEDKAAYYETPNFVREMELHELDDHVILAYEMNGEDLPYLNGYPLRLVIPGYYSDSWVKMISNITVTDKYKSLFFMDVAYRVPDNETESETPDNRFKTTKPITNMNVKSVIGYPENGQKIYHNSHVVIRGVAWDDGHGIKAVKISTDGGETWEDADIKKAGRYAYQTFRFTYKPNKYGKIKIMAKAVDNLGNEQPLAKNVLWNHGGYKYNGIDEVTVEVI